MSYLVDKVKFTIAAATSLFFLFLSIFFFVIQILWVAIIATVLFAIYIYVAIRNLRTVHISEDSVEFRLFGIRQCTFYWSDIKEIGIAGLKVLKPANSKRSGTRYIYFSKTSMTDDERFDMCLKWPPKDKIYCRFSFKCIKYVIHFWESDIVQYNMKKLQIYD